MEIPPLRSRLAGVMLATAGALLVCAAPVSADGPPAPSSPPPPVPAPWPPPESPTATVFVCDLGGSTFTCEDSGQTAAAFDRTRCAFFIPRTTGYPGTWVISWWECFTYPGYPGGSYPGGPGYPGYPGYPSAPGSGTSDPPAPKPDDPAPAAGGEPAAPAAPVPPAPVPPAAQPPSVAPPGGAGQPPAPVPGPRFARGLLRSALTVKGGRTVAVPCRLSRTGPARSCRVTITTVPRRGSKTRRLGRRTLALRRGKRTVAVPLSRSARGSLRRAGKRGLRVRVTVEALDAEGKRLAVTRKTVRLRRR